MHNIGPMEVFIILSILSIIIFGLLIASLPVMAFWKICDRAGLNGALGLLMLVPIANIILPLYVAFTPWPALEQNSNETT